MMRFKEKHGLLEAFKKITVDTKKSDRDRKENKPSTSTKEQSTRTNEDWCFNCNRQGT